MKTWHILYPEEVGDSGEGRYEAVAKVEAETPEEAIKKAKNLGNIVYQNIRAIAPGDMVAVVEGEVEAYMVTENGYEKVV